MYEESLLTLNFESNHQKTLPIHSNLVQQEPFQILYNARSSKNSKSRKGSYCRMSDLPQMLKKPRKMTLPIESTHEYRISQEVVCETYSEQNYPLTYQSLPQQHPQNREDISSMDLEKGIQCAIVEESELDKESWFGIKNENPEFNDLD